MVLEELSVTGGGVVFVELFSGLVLLLPLLFSVFEVLDVFLFVLVFVVLFVLGFCSSTSFGSVCSVHTSFILFPLADFESKEQIREIARENNLKVANKPDSEDICFIPDGNYKKFLEENSNLKAKKGNIVNLEGKILGEHTGLYNYTIGQRKGLGISNPVPLFVLGFNKEKNEVIVGEENKLYKKEIFVKDYNLLLVDEIKEEIEVEVKTRYSSKTAKAKIIEDGDKIKVTFEEPQRAITPGQSAVFYVGDIVLGGGKIQ